MIMKRIGDMGSKDESPKSDLMSPGEVARYFGVNPKTVTKWSAKGYLTECRTLGGHRRFMRDQVIALRANGGPLRGAPVSETDQGA